MEKLFRSLLLVNAVLTTIFFTIPYFDYMWLPYEQLLLLDQSGTGTIIPNSNIVYWGFLTIWLLLTFGLFFYNNLARIGFVVFYIISLLSTLFYGVEVLAPYESLLSSLIGLADGAILVLMYLTNVANKFNQTPNKAV